MADLIVVPNPPGAWLKRYWLWIVLGLAFVIFVVSRLLPTSKGKPEVLEKAKAEADKIHDVAAKELEKHAAKMEANEREFAEIEKISDEEKRLQALAEFANRSGQS